MDVKKVLRKQEGYLVNVINRVKEEEMKKLMAILAVLFVFFSTSAYAEMGMMGGQQGQMGQGMMGDMPMMNCPMQQMGQGMMQGGPMMGQGMSGMMGMDRERMGPHRRWFKYGVTSMLRNADKLGLTDEQIKKLRDIKRKYTKDIIKQDAELKIAEIDLGALLKESEINLTEVKDALKKVENYRTQIKYLRIMAFADARKILSDEQKDSLKKLMEMRPVPGMRGMMSPPQSEEGEEETEEAVEEEDS